MDHVVYFVRHGQTDWNAEGRLQGQADTDLNALGRVQATRNGERLAEFVREPVAFDFVTSPMRRTRETMQRVRRALGLPADGFRIDPRLIEVHFGAWQGFTLPELEQSDPGCTARRDADKWRFLPPGEGAESYEMLETRVRAWLAEVDRDTVCVTHGGVVRAMFHLTGTLDAHEGAALVIPQDRVLRFSRGRLEWL